MDFKKDWKACQSPENGSVITIGNFDGVHLGHRAVIEKTIENARSRGAFAVLFTFTPHPREVLRPELKIEKLLTFPERHQKLKDTLIDLLVEQAFDREFSETSAEFFFNEILNRKLRAKKIIIGYDFAFGKNREGTSEQIEKFCEREKIELEVVSVQKKGGAVISSSHIRELLKQGDVIQANSLLGYSFSYIGTVIHGDQRGRQIGFPTANLALPEKILLPFGVYASRAVVGEKIYPSITNLGIRPTFAGEKKLLLETHLFDTTLDLYNQEIKIEMLARVRDEKKFDSLVDLKNQIALDIAQVKSLTKN